MHFLVMAGIPPPSLCAACVWDYTSKGSSLKGECTFVVCVCLVEGNQRRAAQGNLGNDQIVTCGQFKECPAGLVCKFRALHDRHHQRAHAKMS